MARIILSSVSGLPGSQLPCFYEGFANALKREGNQVLIMITNHLMISRWLSNATRPNVDKEKLDRYVQEFDPDLVISFNNSLYERIPMIVDCPIMLWTSDSPVYFSDVEVLRNSIDRYHIVCTTEHLVENVRILFKISQSRVHIIPPATDFIAEDIPQDKNITFIGSRFASSNRLREWLTRELRRGGREDLRRLIRAVEQNPLGRPEDHLRALDLQQLCLDDPTYRDLLCLLSGNFRAQVLESLSDLGLCIYGTKDWLDAVDYSVDLGLCYDDREVFSVEHNQEIYNSSKININISHVQAHGGMPWRICDIMATNGALVTDATSLPDVTKYFGKYVAIPSYTTPHEARQTCQRLLQDAIWRREIVQASQLAVEEGHRFSHRIRDLQEILGTNLVPGGEGEMIVFNPQEFYKAATESKSFLYRAVRRGYRRFRPIIAGANKTLAGG